MSFSTSSRLLIATTLVWGANVHAFTPPKVGQQYLMVGVTNEPGIMIDDTAPAGISKNAIVWSERLRLGLLHAVDAHFYASAEFELGGMYLNPHTANSQGAATSETALAWQFAIAGRFIPAGDTGGLHLGAGISLMRASLKDAPLYELGFDARTGLILWQGDSFGLLDIGYTFPFIEGLAFPTDFGGTQQRATQDWTLHRAFISLSIGF